MDNLEMQYERLLRHYESVKSTNDKISILDLCHSLRVWVDLFNSNAVDPSFMDSKPFKVAIPGKSILRNNSNLNYIISFMWGGVITMAHENNVFSIDNYSIDDFSMGGEVRYPRTNHSELEVKSFFFYQPNKGSVKNLIAKPIVKRVNLKQWLDGEIVRLNNTEKVIISRKDFINRIANAYGASHSSIDKNKRINRLDSSIDKLMNFKVGNCNLPYFLLLKVAKDLVDNIPKILSIHVKK